MAEVNVQLVAKLREKTGARMMDCKKALVETQTESQSSSGWLDIAELWLRKKNLDKGEKMAEKVATEGLLGSLLSTDGCAITVVEMTANTDFAAKNSEFIKLLADLCALADQQKVDTVEKLAALTIHGVSVTDTIKALAGKIGENIN
ncbi:MAG: elongation factor Ts, partial [Planctomycetota bacterium]